jgi:formylglycine-generating enzyme required for sulfatase activity
VAAVVSLKGIDEAIKNLDYKAKDSPKLRLVQCIRAHYPDEIALATLQAIDPDMLVTAVWNTIPDENRLRSRRKNLASIRSSVNQDLKALFEKGKNPDGITISHSNTFVMSDEAKDQMLTSVAASVGKDGPVSLGQITRTLSLIEDLLARTERFSGGGHEDGESGLRRLKEIIKQISERIDLKVGDVGSEAGGSIASGDGFHRSGGLGSSPGQGGPGDKAAGLGNSLPGLQDQGFSETDGESRGPGSDPVGGDEFFSEEILDEQADIEDVEIIEEPEDLEVVDENPTEGSGDSRGREGLGAVDGSGRGLDGEEGFGHKGPGRDPVGAVRGHLEFGVDNPASPSEDSTISEASQGAGSSDGASANQIGIRIDASGGAGLSPGAEGAAGTWGGPGSDPVEGGDLIPEEILDEQADIEDVEMLEEPADLEVVDEIPTEGSDDSRGGDGFGTTDDSGEGISGKERLEQEGADRETVGSGHGDAEWREKGEAAPGGAEEAERFPIDSGGDEVGAPLEGAQGPGSDFGNEVSGPESEESDSVRTVEDDLIPEESADEEVDLHEMEVIDEPEDLVTEEGELDELEEAVVADETSSEDETSALETGRQGFGSDAGIIDNGEGGSFRGVGSQNGESPNVVVPGGPDQAHPANAGPLTAAGQGDSPDLYGQADLEALDLDEIIEEEDDPDMKVMEETGQPGSGNEEGLGSETGLGPGDEPSDGNQGLAPTPAPEMGLPLGSLGLDSFEDASEGHGGTQKAEHEVLAEAFDGYLGAMERFYNQYIRIPKGAYTIGGGPDPHVVPERRIRLPEFYMGKFPVTNALFEIFVEKTGYRTMAEKGGYGLVYYPRRKREVDLKTGQARHVWNSALVSQRVDGACWYQPLGPGSTLHRKRNHPVVQVTLEDAIAFAAWTGKRLPSEAEWEAASRSRDGRLYPWGNVWQDDCCNLEETQVGDTTPVDAYVEAEGPLGISDTLGNVMEWTLDMDQISENTEGPCYIVKGGSWASTSEIWLCNRFSMPPDARSNILGFRCVAS